MSALPLKGIRILDNGIVQAGTFPARLLGDFGAEVIRVENYSRPDLSRNAVFPEGSAGDPYWEGGGVYHEQFRNKLFCVGLDVRKPEGRDAFLRIAKISDIVLDSHPPGVMEKLHLDYESLKEVNPQVIYLSTSGYGYGGAYSPARSYGMMTEIMCGSGWLNGYAGEDPRRGACPLTDHPSTFHNAFVMMAALVRRKKTGKGAWIDVSQYEVGTNILGDAHFANAIGAPVPTRIGSIDPGAVFSGCFKCDGSDRWVTVSVTSNNAWQALCTTVGLGTFADRDLATDPLDEAAGQLVAEAIGHWAGGRSAEEAFAKLSAAGVASAPVNNVRDLLLDPHLADREFYWTVAHAPEQHTGVRAWPGESAKLSLTPAQFQARAPMLGEHNRHVATEILDYSADEFDAMVEGGSFGTAPLAADMKPPPQDLKARLTMNPAGAPRAKELDEDYIDRLRGRFGAEFGA